MKRWHPLVAAAAAALPLVAAVPAAAHSSAPPPPPQVLGQQLAQLLSDNSPGHASYIKRTKAEANWILDAQLPDGAITQYVDRSRIAPYLGNYGAMGLATAAKVTHQARYSQASWSWLDWYAAHEGNQGFVTDYTVAPDGTESSTGDMDSTDAYAGTFLAAASMTYDVSHDHAALQGLEAGINGAMHAIEATTDNDGLTWAKPSWHVKYLMDEAEVYAGLRGAARLYRALGDDADAATARADAHRLRRGVQGLWNAKDGAFDWAAGDGYTTPTNWNTLYPDAMEQAWAVTFRLTNGAQTEVIDSHLSSEKAWENPNSSAPMQTNGAVQDQTVGYWPAAGLAFGSRIQPVREARSSITSGAVDNVFAWPFTTADMGQLLMLRRAGLELQQKTL